MDSKYWDICRKLQKENFKVIVFDLFTTLIKYRIRADHLLSLIEKESSHYSNCNLSELEIATRLRVQYLNKDCLEMIEYLNNCGIDILFIENTNLQNKYIELSLKKHEIEHLVPNVFSYEAFFHSEYNKAALFVTDNKANIKKFSEASIALVQLPETNYDKEMQIVQREKKQLISDSRLFTDIHNEINFKEFIYSLYSFTEILYRRLLQNNIKHVFFLSREGEFLKKLFDTYRDEQGYCYSQYIQSHYLIVSRKSTLFACLCPLPHEKFHSILAYEPDISLMRFLTILDFSEKEIYEIGNILGIDINVQIKNFPSSQTYSQLIQLPLFVNHYEKCRKDQKKNLIQYIEQFGANIYKDGFHIVDIGWKGTIQNNLYRVFDRNVCIHGYYFGCSQKDASKRNSRNKKYGLMFTYDKITKTQAFNQTKECIIFGKNKLIYEFLLMASHGSAQHYVTVKNKVIVLTKERAVEQQLFSEKIQPIQEKMYEIFLNILALFKMQGIMYPDYKNQFLNIHIDLFKKSADKKIAFFKSIYDKLYQS